MRAGGGTEAPERRVRRMVCRLALVLALAVAGILAAASAVRGQLGTQRRGASAPALSSVARARAVAAGTGAGAIRDGGVYFEPCECADPAVAATNPARRANRCPMEAPAKTDAARRGLQSWPTDGGVLGASSGATSSTGTAYFTTVSTETQRLPTIPGLSTRRAYVSAAVQEAIVDDLHRHGDFVSYYGKGCQEYGFNFSFYINKPTAVEMPPTVKRLAERLVADGFLSREQPPNYVLVNRYAHGEGIHPHVDDAYYSGPIASVTLGAPGVLTFTLDDFGQFFRPRPGTKDAATGLKADAELARDRGQLLKQRRSTHPRCVAAAFAPGSFFAMKDEARYGWKHEMPRRAADSVPTVAYNSTTALVGNDDADAHVVAGSGREAAALSAIAAEALDPTDGVVHPGHPIRTTVDRRLRYSLTFRHVRDDVAAARWAGKSFASTAYS